MNKTRVSCPKCGHNFAISESFDYRKGMMYRTLYDMGYSYREIARAFGYDKGNPQNIKYWIEKAVTSEAILGPIIIEQSGKKETH